MRRRLGSKGRKAARVDNDRSVPSYPVLSTIFKGHRDSVFTDEKRRHTGGDTHLMSHSKKVAGFSARGLVDGTV